MSFKFHLKVTGFYPSIPVFVYSFGLFIYVLDVNAKSINFQINISTGFWAAALVGDEVL